MPKSVLLRFQRHSGRLGKKSDFIEFFLIFNRLIKIKKVLFEQSYPVFASPSRTLITSSAVKFSTV